MRKRFVVELEIPKEATYTEALVYIEDAVASWRGCLRPEGGGEGDPSIEGNPMWYLNPDSVKAFRYVKQIPHRRKTT